MKRARAAVLFCTACITCVAGHTEAQEQDQPRSCPRVHVVDCPEATQTLASLVQAQCLAGDVEEADVTVRVPEGTCDVPALVSLVVDERETELAIGETESHWRFVALAIVETLGRRRGSTAPELDAERRPVPPPPVPPPPAPRPSWVDPRPVATPADREAWLPHYAGLDDTGRGATSMTLRLGVAGSDGIAGMGALSIRHRFESPWTLGVEAHPVLLARLGGERSFALAGAIRGGVDAHYGSVELSLGVTPSRGLRPGEVAPSAGLHLRLGVEDGIGVRLAFEGLYADGVKVQRVMLRIQGLVFRRIRIHSQLEGFFASGFFLARVGVDVWLVGRGDSGSWSLGADLGAALLRFERSCEMGACTMGEDASLSAPAAHLRLEARL
ncbi:MAG: hypothetical protein AB8H86_27120 [Polyangiales bacterium]